jgi:hypothetical protein
MTRVGKPEPPADSARVSFTEVAPRHGIARWHTFLIARSIRPVYGWPRYQ